MWQLTAVSGHGVSGGLSGHAASAGPVRSRQVGESCLVGRMLAPLGRGTWIGLIIRLDVDLALGQHLGKFPLQLLKLGVVRDNVNRSTESVRDECRRGEDSPG